jgi:glucuronate isomerase
MKEKLELHPDRFFSPEPGTRSIARELYETVKNLPIISPHGHVDPALFADENYRFGNPVELFIKPDHYLYRMLYSQGIALEELSIGEEKTENPKKIWRKFADNFYLFRSTPTGIWLEYEFAELFGVKYSLNCDTADEIYEEIDKKLKTPEFSPRNLFKKFNIEVLSTTDEPASELAAHKKIMDSDWTGRVIPSFRTDALTDISRADWTDAVKSVERLTGITINSYPNYLKALEKRREFFKKAGASSTDTAVIQPFTEELSPGKAEDIFQKALKGGASPKECLMWNGNILMELARMSVEDGLVMQLHAGCFRNHNEQIYRKFGPDRGCDIPAANEFTRNLRPLLNKYGNDSRLTLIVFTLDESVYSRELAPLAGHYPCMRLGPAWWFHDSPNGMRRYRERVTETAGLYNTAGFLDDTRAFPSIPARHDLARRIDSDWLAGLVSRHIITMGGALEMAKDCACNLAKKTYKL